MVVLSKSKSHPDLLVYASPRWASLSANNKKQHYELEDDNESVTSSSSSFSSSDTSTRDVLDFQKVASTCIKSNSRCPQKKQDRHQVGALLWQLLLSKQLPVNVHGDKIPWKDLQGQHAILADIATETLQSYHKALTSILILDPDIDDRTPTFLREYKGQLLNHVSPRLLEELYAQRPCQFSAYVADFNDNLAYAMQSTRGLPPTCHTMSQQNWHDELQQLQHQLQHVLQTPNATALELQSSFLHTDTTIPQPAHVDYPWQVLDDFAQHLWLAFFGLTRAGMFLQVWPHRGGGGLMVFVPYGKLLVLPSDTIHGGGFTDVGSHGNLRYHLYVASAGGDLPRFAKNVYTLRHDKRQELSTVCPNAPGLPPVDHDGCGDPNGDHDTDDDDALLMELLFV